jgi:molybdenum cofactor cytidylyltransferase
MSRLGAVILAAGDSSRLGQAKQLLPFRGQTLVRRAVTAATDANCAPVIIVVGNLSAAIRRELDGTSATVVENDDWERGMGTSIRVGIKELSDSTEAAVLLTCDQPLVDSAVIAELVQTQKRTGKPIVASSYANTLGIPAIFDKSCFPALLALPDDSGAKSIIVSRHDGVASISFEDGGIDIDTAEDFERLVARSG